LLAPRQKAFDPFSSPHEVIDYSHEGESSDESNENSKQWFYRNPIASDGVKEQRRMKPARFFVQVSPAHASF